MLGSWQCITHAKAETQAGNKSHVQLYVTSIQGCLCSICDNRAMHLCVPLLPCGALVPGSWQCITHAKAETQAGNKSHVQLYVTSIQGCLCSICDNRAMHLCVPLLPCGALVPGSWQCITHTEAKTQAFGPNAPKHRWLFFSLCHASNESVCTMPHFSVLELAGCCMELCSMK